MGVAPRIVEWLRERGEDAEHLEAQGLQGLPDHQILAKAMNEERVLLTFDLDFAEIVALSGGAAVSVILFRLENLAPTSYAHGSKLCSGIQGTSSDEASSSQWTTRAIVFAIYRSSAARRIEALELLR